MEGYEAIAAMPKAIRVFQPVYRASEWSWPLEAMLVWQRCLQQLDMIDWCWRTPEAGKLQKPEAFGGFCRLSRLIDVLNRS